jgi:hypothetical protein
MTSLHVPLRKQATVYFVLLGPLNKYFVFTRDGGFLEIFGIRHAMGGAAVQALDNSNCTPIPFAAARFDW